MNISSEDNNNEKRKLTDDKYSKIEKKKKIKNFQDITDNFLNLWKKNILTIKEIISKYINDYKDKYNESIDEIFKKIEKLFFNYINDIKNSYSTQYENILRAYEHKIRILYENIFNLKLNKKILEESNKNLLRKEKDYELIKEKTGIIVVNGKLINNSRKENEIFILRKENSILKDIIEKQKKENKIKENKESKEKNLLNKRLITKMHNLSLKTKKHKKNLYDSISPGLKNKRKEHRSNPQPNDRFKSDFISNLNNSLLKNKFSASYRSLLNYPYSKSYQNDLIKNIFTSNRKNKINKSNFINIQVQNNNSKIRRVTPSNAIKKKLIPKITEKKYKSLNKKNIYKQFLQRNFRKRYKSSNPSALGLSITNTHRDISNKEQNSYIRRKNKSECLNEKKLNLLNTSIIKTISTQTNKTKKKGIKYINNLSPTYGNMINLIPKMKNLLNLRMKQNKFSNSFTMKNNNKNLKFINIKDNLGKIKNNYNIKRIDISKKDNSRIKNINNLNNKNIIDYKTDSKFNPRKIKNYQLGSKRKIDNINAMNNIKIKKMIKNHS